MTDDTVFEMIGEGLGSAQVSDLAVTPDRRSPTLHDDATS